MYNKGMGLYEHLTQNLTCPLETVGTGTSPISFKTSGPPKDDTRIALILKLAALTMQMYRSMSSNYEL